MADSAAISIQRLVRQVAVVPITGRTPILPHKWSEKALRQLRKEEGAAKESKGKRDPKGESFAATYWIEDNKVIGMPAVSFKAAIIGAVRQFDLKSAGGMTGLKTLIYVYGQGREQLVPILDAEWSIREDTPRVSTGNPDLRYRNEVFPWRAELEIEFPPKRISLDSVLALVDEAGRGGIGDWRPSAPKSATGIYGQWVIDESREVEIR